MIPRPAAAPVAVAAALALGLAACSGSPHHPGANHSASPSPTVLPGASPTAEAATLRAALDTALRESVDLTGFAVQAAVADGSASPAEKGALNALSTNTNELTSVFGDIYGSGPRSGFVKVWQPRAGYLLEYATGLMTHDPAKVAKATTGLVHTQSAFAAFLTTTTKLPASKAQAALTGQLPALEGAIRAIVAKSPGAGRALENAAGRVDATAGTLAQAIATGKGLAGNPNSPASRLRAGLTALLVQHTAGAMFVVQTMTAAKGSLTDPEVRGALAALTDSTSRLAGAIGGLAGSAAGSRFRALWTGLVNGVVHYAQGKATKHGAEVAAATTTLSHSVVALAGFIHGVTPLPVPVAENDLRAGLQTLERAIDLTTAGSTLAGPTTSSAESQVADTAVLLASGFVAEKPGDFGG